MRKRIATGSLVALLLATVVVMPGCSSGAAAGTITGVTLSPTSASVGVNSTAEFTATVTVAGSSSTTSTNTTVTFQVNGVNGGSAATGTIVPDPTDAQVGIYTAPATVPTTNNGQVNITAIAPINPATSTTTTTTATVTSNTVVVTITVGLGLLISPSAIDVRAGGSQQFSATLNGVADNTVVWSVAAPNGGNPGTIDPSSGIYTAPPTPPTGGTVTISANDKAAQANATATATIIYADASFSGPFAFSYSGNNSAGFQAAAGSLVSDGDGDITNFVEDVSSFQSGTTTVSCAAQPGTPCGTYVVGPDGRGTITLNSGQQTTNTIQFVVTTQQHALISRFDASETGSGTMDQQNLADLGGSTLVIAGNYVLRAFGGDTKFAAKGIAGAFTASGNGQIPAINSIVDQNDGGTIAIEDVTLQGSYSFDNAFPGTGRGTLTLTSTNIGSLSFAFYIVDGTHLYIVENDKNGFLVGDVFSGIGAPAGGGQFTVASLAKGSYPFTVGGSASKGGYSAGGVFVSDGNGNVTTASVFDNNNGGDVQLNPMVVGCAYTVDPATGRIAMSFSVAGAACAVAPASGSPNTATNAFTFAVYQTNLGSAVMLELDGNVIAGGTAFQQQIVSSTLTGNSAFNLGAQGVLHTGPGPNQQDAIGQAIFNGSTVTSGNLDINAFTQLFSNDPISTICTTGTNNCTTVSAPASSGRGTMVLALTNPATTYNIVFYQVNANMALLFGQADGQTGIVQTGILQRQF